MRARRRQRTSQADPMGRLPKRVVNEEFNVLVIVEVDGTWRGTLCPVGCYKWRLETSRSEIWVVLGNGISQMSKMFKETFIPE